MDITLDDIVRSSLANDGKNSLHGYIQRLKWCVDFMRKLNLEHSFYDRTVVLRLDERKAVKLPDDFQNWNKIGWQKGDRIIAFQQDNSINKNQSYCADNPSATVNTAYDIHTPWPYNNSFTSLNFNNYYFDNGTVGYLQGYGVGYNGLGYFKVNRTDRVIQISSDVPQDFQIYLEYKTNGFNPKSKSVVPEAAGVLAEYYIKFRSNSHKLGDAAAETVASRMEFDRQYDQLVAQLYPTSYEDLVGARARAFSVNKIVF